MKAIAAAIVLSCGACIAGYAYADTMPPAAEPLPFDRTPVSIKDTPVLDRTHSGYEPVGISAGDFTLYPQIGVGEWYDDNLFATTNQTVGDLRTVITPDLLAKSNWATNSASLDLHGDIERYFDRPNEAVNDGGATGTAQYDGPDYLTLSGLADYEHETEARSSTLSPRDVVRPIQFDFDNVQVGIARPFDRLRLSLTADLSETDFQDGVTPTRAPVVETIFDTQEAFLDGKVAYVINPDTAVVLDVTGNTRHFTHDAPATVGAPAIDRDSSGFEITTGLNLALTHLLRAELLAGYLDQTYVAGAVFRPVNGPTFHVKLDFLPTGLTTLSLDLDRKVNDAQDATASSYLSTKGHFQVDHELYRNIIVSGSVDYEQDAYSGIRRLDDVLDGRVYVTYLMDRHFSIKATFDRLSVTSIGSARLPGYDVDQFSVTLVSRY